MKKMSGYIFIVSFLIHSYAWADVDDNWRCTAHDKANHEWVAEGTYERIALNKAFDECKKASEFPVSCSIAKGDCESFTNGVTTSPMFQCTSLDQRGNPWVSNSYRNPDDALLAAKAFCHDRSPLPATCYSYPLFCRNVMSNN